MLNAVVQLHGDEVRADSRDVAAAFEKNHRDVLRAIDSMIKQEPCLTPAQFCAGVYSMEVTGRQQHRHFLMTRDGFALLAMGFTGQKALKWKLAYIEAFNRMEAALKEKAANDTLSMIPTPYLGTKDDANQIRTAVLLVRECKDLFGPQAGREMWQKLGFPIPGVDMSPAPSPPPPAENAHRAGAREAPCAGQTSKAASFAAPTVIAAAPEGDLYSWAAKVGIKPSRRDATSVTDLFESYAQWCSATRQQLMPPLKFAQAVKMLFGTEEHPEMIRVIIARK